MPVKKKPVLKAVAKPKISVAEQLRKSADIFESRNPTYGAQYKRIGNILSAYFPNGVELKTPEDFTRFSLLSSIMGKMGRYAHNFNSGGHEDSVDDSVNYAAMLAEVDNLIAEFGEIK